MIKVLVIVVAESLLLSLISKRVGSSARPWQVLLLDTVHSVSIVGRHSADARFLITMGVEDPAALVSVDFEVFGNVQGVYFTKFCRELADQLHIGGWVKNSKKGTIVGKMQSTRAQLDIMIDWLSNRGSPGSKVEKCELTNWEQTARLDYQNFTIRF